MKESRISRQLVTMFIEDLEAVTFDTPNKERVRNILLKGFKSIEALAAEGKTEMSAGLTAKEGIFLFESFLLNLEITPTVRLVTKMAEIGIKPYGLDVLIPEESSCESLLTSLVDDLSVGMIEGVRSLRESIMEHTPANEEETEFFRKLLIRLDTLENDITTYGSDVIGNISNPGAENALYVAKFKEFYLAEANGQIMMPPKETYPHLHV
jgi:hypothetical protein